MAIPRPSLLLVAQALFHYRDAVAAHWPATKPVARRALCAAAGCAIRPLRDVAMRYLSIDASDLQADPAHKGLLILTATCAATPRWPLAYPYLEFTLTDAKDATVVVRRALAPSDYAGGTRTDRQRHPGERRGPDQALHRRERDDTGGLSAVHVLP